MNVSRIMILVVAVIAGGAAFYLAMSGGGDEQVSAPQIIAPAEPKVAMTKVLFASGDIAQGTPITEEQMKWVNWPSKDVPEFLVTEDNEEFLAALPEMRARQAIMADEPIYERNTVAYGDRGLMAAIMTPGMRAVTARLSEEQVSGGFVLPGDRVDIFATRSVDTRDLDDTQLANTRVVLSNVRVLAIDQIFEADGEMNSLTGKTVTLEVTPAQVRPFLQARSSEELTLVLRSVFEEDFTGTEVEQSSPDQVVVVRYGQG